MSQVLSASEGDKYQRYCRVEVEPNAVGAVFQIQRTGD
ncbi:hypothetical protein C352_03221 [Cryptococcus neoformans CHC193]|nr:hypothetical protein C352_03221 [Cryptococcus neoformans var. grubii CHC193]